jgi:hypothetical protein
VQQPRTGEAGSLPMALIHEGPPDPALPQAASRVSPLPAAGLADVVERLLPVAWLATATQRARDGCGGPSTVRLAQPVPWRKARVVVVNSVTTLCVGSIDALLRRRGP